LHLNLLNNSSNSLFNNHNEILVIFIGCKFKYFKFGNIQETTSNKIKVNFLDCNFKKLDCSFVQETKPIEVIINGGSIEDLQIIDSTFVKKFHINKQYSENEIQINKLTIRDSTFKENFKLLNAKVNIFKIENTDFEKHADFFKSEFNGIDDITFKGINFRGLALFGDTTFEKKLIFKYVTFEGYSHFMNANLGQGLDLDYSNIQNEINFFGVQQLNTEQAKKNTSQETYRIIKYNFEKIGNKIEANKYLALELEQRKNTLEKTQKNYREYLDLFVFKINWWSSEFGTNWLKPLVFILLTSVITIWLMHFSLFIELIQNPFALKVEYIIKIIKELPQYMYLLNKSDSLTSNPTILLMNKALLSYLYYQFLISIRKNTK